MTSIDNRSYFAPLPAPSAVGRRRFLADAGMGMTGMALSTLLFKDGVARASEIGAGGLAGAPHHEPKAKSVIWIFLIGGLSHLESFDPKPALNRYAGMSIDDTPHADILDEDRVNEVLLNPKQQERELQKKIMPLQVGYKHYGESGIAVSDWFPRIGACIDDIAVVRSMWTIDNDHGAQLTFHTGRKVAEGAFPTVGSWVSYGLGTLNRNLPEYVVLGEPSADCCGAAWTHGSSYLGPQHAGVRLKDDPKNPLAFVRPDDESQTIDEQRENFSLLGRLNRLSGIEYPDDEKLKARIKAYELAFEMQTAVPDSLDLEKETGATRNLYGLDQDETRGFGRKCIAARRLVERGVRFVQLFHGGNGGAGAWDSHQEIKKNHSRLAKEVDQPMGALIKDLKQRGMLKDTLVVIATEFGRTPGAEFRKDNPNVTGTGRDHHPHGFSVLLAGGGVRGGMTHGATDELGFHAVEDRHFVTDIHATVLHLMGLDTRRLVIPGRDRVEMDYGKVIREIIA